MLRFLFISLLFLMPALAHAQAPIERQASAAPLLDPDWQKFARTWNPRQGAEVSVKGFGHPLHCHLDFISNEDLECVVYGRRSWFYSESDIHYTIPRTDVREVHISSRAASALIGIAAGFGIAAIAAPTNPNATDKGSEILYAGILGAPVTGGIGYLFPLRGRTIFRKH